MCHKLPKAKARSTVRRLHFTTSLETFQCEVAWSVVLLGDRLESLNHFRIVAFGQVVLWRLLEAYHGDTEYAQDQDKGSITEPDVAPAL